MSPPGEKIVMVWVPVRNFRGLLPQAEEVLTKLRSGRGK